jgi:hypothetical protein
MFFVIFGGLAVVATFVAVDPWLCVAGFRRFCLYRMSSYEQNNSTLSMPRALQRVFNPHPELRDHSLTQPGLIRKIFINKNFPGFCLGSFFVGI